MGEVPLYRGTSLTRKRIPLDLTVGLYLGSSGGPRGVGGFLLARYPCTQKAAVLHFAPLSLIEGGPLSAVHCVWST